MQHDLHFWLSAVIDLFVIALVISLIVITRNRLTPRQRGQVTDFRGLLASVATLPNNGGFMVTKDCDMNRGIRIEFTRKEATSRTMFYIPSSQTLKFSHVNPNSPVVKYRLSVREVLTLSPRDFIRIIAHCDETVNSAMDLRTKTHNLETLRKEIFDKVVQQEASSTKAGSSSGP